MIFQKRVENVLFPIYETSYNMIAEFSNYFFIF